MTKTRTFIAVAISEGVRRRAQQAIERLSPSGAKVKWVEPFNMHITLKFLGDVLNEETIEVCRAVAHAVQHQDPFQMQCYGLGAFPSASRPRTVWAGVTSGAEQMGQLQQAVEHALRELGFPEERRRYVPHLTLGRVRGGGAEQRELGRLLDAHAQFELGSSQIDEVLVMASYPDKSGPKYEALGRAPLGAE